MQLPAILLKPVYNFKENKMRKMLISRGIFIVFITLLVYLPALQNEFVNWDDPKYIVEMQRFQPINMTNIHQIFTGFYVANWHPLTILSHAIDYRIWGLNPFWHHLGNNILHGFNTLLVLILTFQLVTVNKIKGEGRRYALSAASITALLFAIHPLHVESVAWVSERKDLLCAFFFLLSIIFYNKYRSSDSKKAVLYFCTLFSFMLSLFSKPMAVTLPLVLLILDFYPLRGFTKEKDHRQIMWLIVEKIPFFIFSLIASVLTMKAQVEFNALSSTRVFPLMERLLNGIHSLAFYWIKMLFPFNLAPLYPYPGEISFFSPEYLFSAIAVVLITLFALLRFNKNKLYFSVWIYYLVTLLPVIGIIQAGGQSAADRYIYLPGVAPFILAGLACSSLVCGKEKVMALLARAAILFCSLLLVIVTVKQTGIWQNSLNLWNHEIKVLPKSSPFIYNNRGTAYMQLKKYEEANADFAKAIELGPTYLDFYRSRGNSYMELGHFAEAIYDYSHIIKIDDKNEIAYNSRGAAYHILGRTNEARRDYEKALEINPDNGRAFYNIALIFEEAGEMEQAFLYYQKAASLGIAEAVHKLQ